MAIRLSIAGGHAAVRQVPRTVLSLDVRDPIEVVGEAADGRKALGLVRRLQPDVVQLSPPAAARQVRAVRGPDSPEVLTPTGQPGR